MKTLHAFFLYAVIPIAVVGFTVSLALADVVGSTADATPQNLAALWPMLGLAVATIASYAVRKLAAEYTFWHTGWGAVVLGALGSVVTAVTPVFQAGEVTWIALVWAAVGAVTSFFATLNPSTTHDAPAAKSPSSRGLTALLPLVLVALSLTGCAAEKATMSTELTLATAITSGYRVVDGVDKLKVDEVRQLLLTGEKVKANELYVAVKPRVDRARHALDVGDDILQDAEKSRQLYKKGLAALKDFTKWLPALGSAIANIEQVISDVKALVH